MSEQEKNNRSSALSPEALGAINVATAAAVKEAVAGVFASLAPLLQEMAITPEKLREANKPYVDPSKALRELREKLLWQQDEAENRRKLRQFQDACPHLDGNGRSSISLVHNFPDRQPRGLCVLCHDLIHPKEWRIGAPDAENPRGKAYLVEPHKSHQAVLTLQAKS